jgi:hypothetical protein
MVKSDDRRQEEERRERARNRKGKLVEEIKPLF